MWIDYPAVITESLPELAQRERELRGTPQAVRAHLLRLLKSGQIRSLAQCAPLLGYSTIQLTRWWEQYCANGLIDLLAVKPAHGKAPKMTDEAWRALRAELQTGRIARLEDARWYLAQHWDIHYASVNGIWHWFRKHKVKGKTGRRRHRQASAEAHQALKTLARHSKQRT